MTHGEATSARLWNLPYAVFSLLALALFPIHITIAAVSISVADPLVAMVVLLAMTTPAYHPAIGATIRRFAPFVGVCIASIAWNIMMSRIGSAGIYYGPLELVKLGFTIVWVCFAAVVGWRLGPSGASVAIIAVLPFSLLVFGNAAIHLLTGVSERLRWPFTNPNVLGNYCVFIFCMAWSGYLCSTRWVKKLLPGVIAAAFIGVLASGSRGASVNLMVAVLLIGFCLWVFARKQPGYHIRVTGRQVIAVLAGVVTIGILVAVFHDSPVVERRIRNTLDPDGPKNLDTRLILWGIAQDLFYQQPLLGAGYGQFQVYSYDVGGTRDMGGLVTHNLYLALLSETGILGLAAYLFAIGGICLGAWRLAWRSRLTFVFPIIGYVVGTMSQGFVANVDNYRALALAVGLLLGVSVHAKLLSSTNMKGGIAS